MSCSFNRFLQLSDNQLALFLPHRCLIWYLWWFLGKLETQCWIFVDLDRIAISYVHRLGGENLRVVLQELADILIHSSIDFLWLNFMFALLLLFFRIRSLFGNLWNTDLDRLHLITFLRHSCTQSLEQACSRTLACELQDVILDQMLKRNEVRSCHVLPLEHEEKDTAQIVGVKAVHLFNSFY